MTGDDLHGRLSEHLDAVARGLPLSSVEVADVEQRVRRSQMRRRLVAGAAAAVVAGLVGVLQVAGGAGDSSDVGLTADSTPTTTTDPMTTTSMPSGADPSVEPSEFGPDPVVWQDALWTVSQGRVVRSVDGQEWVDAGVQADGTVSLDLVVSGARLFVVDSTVDEVAVWSTSDGESWAHSVAFDRPFGLSQVVASDTYLFLTVRSGPIPVVDPGATDRQQAQRALDLLLFERFGAMSSLDVQRDRTDPDTAPSYSGTVRIRNVAVWQGPLLELGLTMEQIDALYRTPLTSPDEGNDPVVDGGLAVRRFASADGRAFVELDPQPDPEIAIRSNLGLVTNTPGGVSVLADVQAGAQLVEIPGPGPVAALVATDIGLLAQTGAEVYLAGDDQTGLEQIDLGVKLGDIVEFATAPGSVGVIVWNHSDDPRPRLVVLDVTGDRQEFDLDVPAQADRWRWELWPLPDGSYKVFGRTVDQGASPTTVTTQTITVK